MVTSTAPTPPMVMGFLMDIAGHRDVCHHFVERRPQRCDVGF